MNEAMSHILFDHEKSKEFVTPFGKVQWPFRNQTTDQICNSLFGDSKQTPFG